MLMNEDSCIKQEDLEILDFDDEKEEQIKK